MRQRRLLAGAAILLASGALAGAPALAAGQMQNGAAGTNKMMQTNENSTTNAKTDGTTNATTNGMAENDAKETNDAKELVNEAKAEVKTMKKDPQLKKLMAKAKGIYLVPKFGRGALIVGGRGGAGVVLAHVNGKWTNPAFYDFGGISFGAEAGASGGPIAFLLMTKGAVDQFKSGNKISLNAGAGLSIVTYSANAQASWGKGDIIMWSNTKGAYAGATISVTDINWSDGNNKAYYGRKVDPSQVLAGKVNTPNAEQLKQMLPG